MILYNIIYIKYNIHDIPVTQFETIFKLIQVQRKTVT